MSGELVTAESQIGVPSQTVQKLHEIESVIASVSAPELVDALVYTDAVLTVAREKRAAEVAREAARVRIMATRRLGEILRDAPEQERERIWDVMPTRFGRCEELAGVPERHFKRAVHELIEADSACSIASIIRRAERNSLQQVEPGIFRAFNGRYWTKGRGAAPQSAQTTNIEEARRKFGLKANPHAIRLDEAYSKARLYASELANLGPKLPSNVRSLVSSAGLSQMRVAELLDEALRGLVEAGGSLAP